MNKPITHSVFFRLKHPAGSAEEKAFLETSRRVLAPIPGVEDFRVLKQTSVKNDFDYGLVMLFDDQAAYDAYNNHPDHVGYVQGTWIPNVAEFLEIDHVDL
jgi:heme-degrading monooxygenase HmoA